MHRHTSHRHNDQRSHQTSWPDRNQLRYGNDNSAYDDDYWSRDPYRSPSGRQRTNSGRSMADDRNYTDSVGHEHRHHHTSRNSNHDARGFRNERYEGNHSGGRYEPVNRLSGYGDGYNAHHDKYQGDGRFGSGGESRRGRWTEDDSFYEYRNSLHNRNAMRSAWHDMHGEDAGYFDRDNRNADWYVDRQWQRQNISDEDYRRQRQRSHSYSPHRSDRWPEHDDRRYRQSNERESRGRYRRW